MISFQTYFPRVRPLEYDALALQIGCQDVNGVGFRGFKPIVRFCAAEHDAASGIFNQPATVASCLGPARIGFPLPAKTPWVAWLAKDGIRIASNLLPSEISDTVGTKTALFGAQRPSSLSIAFTRLGFPAIAIQDTATGIEIARANSDSVSRFTFAGTFPVLWQVGTYHAGEDATESELVCFYLRPGAPQVILARFESEAFATERTILSDVPSILASLIQADAEDGRLILRARDQVGIDISMYGALDAVTVLEYAMLNAGFLSGRHVVTGASIDIGGGDVQLLSAGFTSGLHILRAKYTETLDTEGAIVSAGFLSGNYS